MSELRAVCQFIVVIDRGPDLPFIVASRECDKPSGILSLIAIKLSHVGSARLLSEGLAGFTIPSSKIQDDPAAPGADNAAKAWEAVKDLVVNEAKRLLPLGQQELLTVGSAALDVMAATSDDEACAALVGYALKIVVGAMCAHASFGVATPLISFIDALVDSLSEPATATDRQQAEDMAARAEGLDAGSRDRQSAEVLAPCFEDDACTATDPSTISMQRAHDAISAY
ncbi:hypothetical protein [Actinomadura parmotrematis]|uniref:Uncharacterized protein n=1 Tax=Actinomadura parmotrematis TaxID=2864039 RepID=A0ABS7FN80_9ACTN|nr:hypothetical protein [Actinomadura parmotrematis]MBW8481844.1 hypothetical protein [Actinomadura parmotrematis]